MDGMVMEVGVPVTIPNVEVTSHDYCVFYVHHVVAEVLQGYLVAIWVSVDDKVYVSIIVEDQEIYVLVVDNIWSEGKPHAC